MNTSNAETASRLYQAGAAVLSIVLVARLLYWGAGLSAIWPQLAALAGIGVLFAPYLPRFLRMMGTMA